MPAGSTVQEFKKLGMDIRMSTDALHKVAYEIPRLPHYQGESYAGESDVRKYTALIDKFIKKAKLQRKVFDRLPGSEIVDRQSRIMYKFAEAIGYLEQAQRLFQKGSYDEVKKWILKAKSSLHANGEILLDLDWRDSDLADYDKSAKQFVVARATKGDDKQAAQYLLRQTAQFSKQFQMRLLKPQSDAEIRQAAESLLPIARKLHRQFQSSKLLDPDKYWFTQAIQEIVSGIEYTSQYGEGYPRLSRSRMYLIGGIMKRLSKYIKQGPTGYKPGK